MAAIMSIWWDKTYYDGRYVVGDDLFHRFFEVAHLVALALVVVHIRPIEILSSPDKYVDAFGLCISLAITKFLFFIREIEVYFFGVGERQLLERAIKGDATPTLLITLLFVAAAIVTGLEFFDTGSDSSHRRGLAGAEEETGDGYAYETKKSSEPNDIPIYIILAAELLRWIIIGIRFVLAPSDGSHKKYGKLVFLLGCYCSYAQIAL